MNYKLVTIIILTYNNYKGACETLRSVLKQEYPQIEVIVSDDGSKDFKSHISEIEDIFKNEAGDNLTRFYINAISQNGGTVKNINNALNYAKGDYIKLISSDDTFINTDAITHYVDFMEKNKFLICFSKIRGVDDEGKYHYNLLACDNDYDKLKKYSVKDTEYALYSRNFLPAPASFFKKDIFEMYGKYDEDIVLIEDYSYWLKLAQNNVRFGYIDEVMINYRFSGVSSTGNYGKKFMEDMFLIYDKYIFSHDNRFGAFQKIYNFLKKWGLKYYYDKADFDSYGISKKVIFFLKYWMFSIYVNLQKMRIKG